MQGADTTDRKTAFFIQGREYHPMSFENSTMTAAPETKSGAADRTQNAVFTRDSAGGYIDPSKSTSSPQTARRTLVNAIEAKPARKLPDYLTRYAELLTEEVEG